MTKPCLIVNKITLRRQHHVLSLRFYKPLFFNFTTILLSHSESWLGPMLRYVLPLSQLKVMDEASQAIVYTESMLS